jgi:uncharacterized protein YqeY
MRRFYVAGAQEHGSGQDRPSDLKDRLAAEMAQALKAGQKVRLGALRLLSSSVKYREVELGHPLSDDEFVEVATREVKGRREAVGAYREAGREDRAATELEEQGVLEAYLPVGLSGQEVADLVGEAVAATGASGPGDLGKVMGFVMRRARGRVEGRVIQDLVRARLTGQDGPASQPG